MPSEIEIKLAMKSRQGESRIRRKAELGFSIWQCYVAARGKRKASCVRIRRFGKNRYLEIFDPEKSKKKRFWRAKLSRKAWKRIRDGSRVLRVRRSEGIQGEEKGNVFFAVTIKEDSGELKRHEWEKPIPRWAFRLLRNADRARRKQRKRIKKKRYYVHEQGRVLHFDFYRGALRGLELVEIEFSKTRKALRFQKKHGERRAGEIRFTDRPKCIKGVSIDVTARRKAGNRTLSTLRKPPKFF